MSIASKMKVGDKFTSFEEFQVKLEQYKKEVSNEYWFRDAKTIENQRSHWPKTVENVNNELKYYFIKVCCIKGGRVFQSKNGNSKRLSMTCKQNCEAGFVLKLSSCKQFLCITQVNENHNHSSSKAYFSCSTTLKGT